MAHLKQKAPCPLSLLTADLLEPFSLDCSSQSESNPDKSRPSSATKSNSSHQSPARTATVHNPYSFEGLLEVVLEDKVDPPEAPTWCSIGLPLSSRECRFASLAHFPAANSKPVLYMPAPLITSCHPRICKSPGHVTIPEPNAMPAAKGMNTSTAMAKLQPAVTSYVSSKSAALSTPRQTVNGSPTRFTAYHRSVSSPSSGQSNPPAQKGNSPTKWKRHGVKVSHEEVLQQLRIYSSKTQLNI